MLVLGMVFIVTLHAFPRLFAERVKKVFATDRMAFYFLAGWILLAVAAF